MSRPPFAAKYTPEQQSRIDSLLRRYQYGCLDLVLSELELEGVRPSRSALGRHAQRLRSKDAFVCSSADSTMVIIVDLRTGGATQLRTSATPEVVTAAICSVSPAAITG